MSNWDLASAISQELDNIYADSIPAILLKIDKILFDFAMESEVSVEYLQNEFRDSMGESCLSYVQTAINIRKAAKAELLRYIARCDIHRKHTHVAGKNPNFYDYVNDAVQDLITSINDGLFQCPIDAVEQVGDTFQIAYDELKDTIVEFYGKDIRTIWDVLTYDRPTKSGVYHVPTVRHDSIDDVYEDWVGGGSYYYTRERSAWDKLQDLVTQAKESVEQKALTV